MAESIFSLMYGGYEWAELRVYRHPANKRKYVVDGQTGCSCYDYEIPTDNELRDMTPLTKTEARKQVADWAADNSYFDDISDKAGQRVKAIEAFNNAVK